MTITTIGETPVNLSSLTQVSQISSDQSAEVTTISGLPPGVSLIQAEQGQDGEGAIFLLVTGPVDGEGGTANAIAVDAATAAAMASLQNPLEAVTSGQSISIEELATAVSTSTGKNQNDSVAEILSSLTGWIWKILHSTCSSILHFLKRHPHQKFVLMKLINRLWKFLNLMIVNTIA